MAIIDEPVRGSIPPLWWWSLSGLERIQALARGYIPQPPLCRLLGIRPGHVGPGSGTWTMPATAALQLLNGELDILVFIETALRGIAMTVLDPGFTVEPITVEANHFRPARPAPGKFVARGRVINSSRFFTFTELQIEDTDGRQLMHATSHAEIRRVEPEPPPAPAELTVVDEPNYATPDPYLRPIVARLPSLEEYESDVVGAFRGLSDGRFVSPLANLFGLKLVDWESGTMSSIPASEWFCLFSRNVSPGVIAAATSWSGGDASARFAKPGQSFVGLSQHIHLLGSVPADGRILHIESQSDGRSGGSSFFDADRNLIARQVGVARFVDRAQRQQRAVAQAKRALCTLLFTDIVGSTQHAERLGDQKWHALLEEHWRVVRMEVNRWRGMEINTTGDGFFVRFDSPGDALDCAIAAREAVKPLGIEIRAGVHTGECEVTGRNLAGMAVHIGARIQAAAGPSEIFVSSTVKDLVMGSGRTFTDRGEHELKGVPGAWRLYALA